MWETPLSATTRGASGPRTHVHTSTGSHRAERHTHTGGEKAPKRCATHPTHTARESEDGRQNARARPKTNAGEGKRGGQGLTTQRAEIAAHAAHTPRVFLFC